MVRYYEKPHCFCVVPREIILLKPPYSVLSEIRCESSGCRVLKNKIIRKLPDRIFQRHCDCNMHAQTILNTSAGVGIMRPTTPFRVWVRIRRETIDVDGFDMKDPRGPALMRHVTNDLVSKILHGCAAGWNKAAIHHQGISMIILIMGEYDVRQVEHSEGVQCRMAGKFSLSYLLVRIKDQEPVDLG